MSNHPERVQKYRIKSVASSTGLSTHIIRKWEERYQWHQGGISLRGEQSVSRLVRQYLINVVREESHPGGPHAFMACVPGDFHEIGPLTAAMLLRRMGWHSIYLGPNVSFEILNMALRRKQAQLIILACNIEPGEKTIQSWLRDITQHLQPSCPVMVGGPGFAPDVKLLSTHKISYFGHVQDVKAVQPRTHLPRIARGVSQATFTT